MRASPARVQAARAVKRQRGEDCGSKVVTEELEPDTDGSSDEEERATLQQVLNESRAASEQPHQAQASSHQGMLTVHPTFTIPNGPVTSHVSIKLEHKIRLGSYVNLASLASR